MEPYFLICTKCHEAYTWSHRDVYSGCPNKCPNRFSMPYNNGFGPDKAPVPRHPSTKFMESEEERIDYKIPEIYIKNVVQMRKLCQ